MVRIPLLIGFGGISPAGRSSFHHGYRRLVIDKLSSDDADRTYRSLAGLMGLDISDLPDDSQKQFMRDHTLVRQIDSACFDTEHLPWNQKIPASIQADQPLSFTTKARNLPKPLPPFWSVSDQGAGLAQVTINGNTDFLVPTERASIVRAAGQLPSGFDPSRLYQARSHPRGLQMTVYGASDAISSMGIDWQELCNHVSPDQISTYAGSALGQLDQHGNGGMLGARFNNKRTTSKHLAFGLPEMPADFINAYVVGSVGSTGGYTGACATFLYNLKQGIADIQTGKARVVIVGGSEAPVVPDVIDGFAAMGALATDDEILALDADQGRSSPDYRRASRPFSSNCGFTIAESAQCAVLCDDELAMVLGASVYGAVSDVFVNADGFKKSISSPGVGNYVTVAKAVAAGRAILGDESVQRRSFVQAHGTSTPQNRVSESHILNQTAKAFGIENWPVAAIKSYLGHSIATAAGDQMMATLGVWEHGLIPGINTIDHVAEDVFDSNLQFSPEHIEVGREGIDMAILNSKGFGGNNASATVLAPHIVNKMLAKKHGKQAFSTYLQRNEQVRANAADYDESASRGEALPIYKFDNNVIPGENVDICSDKIRLPGYEQEIDLKMKSPYADLL